MFKQSLARFMLLALMFALALPASGGGQVQAAQIFLLPGIGINTLPYSYTQNFDSLISSGSGTWTDNSTLAGWSAKRSGNGTDIAADTGSSTSGKLYSYGASLSTDRALGSIGSGNAAAGNFFWGTCFKNNSGAEITQLDIAYDGEQWRKSGETTAQVVDFDYQIGSDCVEVNAASGWTAHNALDFSSPVNTTGGAAIDGNTTGKVSLNSSITLSIPNGQAITLRWYDPNHSGSDHGMAMDNFSLTATGGAPVDNPPTVSSTTPANNATGVVISSNLSINFNEDVTVSGSWAQVACNSSGTQSVGGGTLTVSGGPQNYTLNPSTDFAHSESCTATLYATQIVDQDGTPDNMAADYTWSFSTESDPGAPIPIHTVQGSGSSSPLDGQSVIVEGIVVDDFQNTVNGFFLQEEDADADGSAATSEGIFIYSTSAVNVGDKVRVTGTISEYFNETQITPSNVTIMSSGNSLPTATSINLPVSATSDWEQYEGMLLQFPQTLKVTEVYLLGRGGLITLADQMLYQPTHLAAPGAPALAVAAENAKHTIILDDGSQAENPDPVKYPTPAGLSASNTVRVGYNVSGVTGVLTQRYHGWSGSTNTYRIYPTADPTFDSSGNPRTATPPNVGGVIQVASFNVLNYFNGDGFGGGFPTARGADTAAEFTRQRDKIINAILALDAEVVGLMEIENDGYDATSAIQDLVNGLNAVAGAGTYAFINPNAPATGAFGSDEIAVGMIYKPAFVTPIGTTATTTTGAFTQGADRRQRQPIAQAFQHIDSGEIFIVVVNHFKSKGSSCAAANGTFPADPDTGDGQGNCNITRTMAAQDLLTWLATNPTGTGDPDIFILGDLNSYANEDPITTLKTGGYIDLINTYHGTSGYSYVFDGQLGYLDHALASASLLAKVTGTDDWHINGVEPVSLDYNLEFKSVGQQSSFYSTEPYRASDHDPVLIGLFDYDTGDLPAGYGSPKHYTPQTKFLGADARVDDGVSIQSSGNWKPGNPVTVRANVTGGSGWLACWLDWDLSGTFEGDEKTINQAVSTGDNDITFNVPGDAAVGIGTAIALPVRCRLYESGSEPTALNRGPIGVNAASPLGSVIGGEVEDYQWNFGPNAIALSELRALSENHAGAWGGILLTLGLLAFLGGVGILRRR